LAGDEDSGPHEYKMIVILSAEPAIGESMQQFSALNGNRMPTERYCVDAFVYGPVVGVDKSRIM
jgi:hypothetical protein